MQLILRSEFMPFPVYLPLGDHELTKPVLGWTAQVIEPYPTVELLASLESHPAGPSWPSRGQTATSLAIRMHPQAAMKLYSTLHELARSMDWPLPQ
jgi:hypothetical protein